MTSSPSSPVTSSSPAPANDDVVALVAVELVVTAVAVHAVRAGATLGVVVARAAVDGVTTVVAVQVVVAVLAVGDVVAAAEPDVVVAGEAVDLLGATLGDDRVVAGGALHRLAVDRSRSAWLRAGRGLARRRSGDRGSRDGGQAQDLGRHERSEQPGSWGERTHVAKVTRPCRPCQIDPHTAPPGLDSHAPTLDVGTAEGRPGPHTPGGRRARPRRAAPRHVSRSATPGT